MWADTFQVQTIRTRLPVSSFLQLSILTFRPKFFRHYILGEVSPIPGANCSPKLYRKFEICFSTELKINNNKNLRNTWKELKLKLEQTRWSSHKLQNQKLQIQQVENAICVRAFKWWVKKMYLCSRTIFKMLAKNWGQTAQVRYRSGLGSRCSLNMTTKRYKSKQSTKDYATSNFTTTVTVLEIHNNMWKGFFGLFLRP